MSVYGTAGRRSGRSYGTMASQQELDVEIIRRLVAIERELEVLRARGPARPIVARYTVNASQNIANNTTTIIDYAALVYDTHGRVTTGANWSFTAATAGYYDVRATISFAATNTWVQGEAAELRLFKNNAIHSILDYRADMDGVASILVMLGGSDTVYLAVGDCFDVRILQGSGGTLATPATATRSYIAVRKR